MNGKANKILIIDDDRAVCASIGLLLKKNHYIVDSTHHPSDVMDKIDAFLPGLILLDMNFTIETSGKQGLSLLRKIREKHAGIHVILMTGWATVQLAVEGMKLGAKDFIAKPWDNKHLVDSIRAIFDIYSDSDEKTNGLKDETGAEIIGKHPRFLEVMEMAKRVASTEASVLILGESGTGKELLAEAIHKHSLRSKNPFVKVNLGGISGSLFESEMFGHKKGAFTDAYADRVGRFSAADKGTIFLDEIGELRLDQQVKLLRVLQEKAFEILGESQTQKSDFRLISATNKSLQQAVFDGDFREDLFYRINLITLQLPSLSERKSDIPELVKHFSKQISNLYNRQEMYFPDETIAWLSQQSFPGNIRDLKNQVERTILLNFEERELKVEHFLKAKKMMGHSSSVVSLPEVGAISLDKMEESMIRKAMIFHESNISKAARSLGITRSALYRRLEKYNIPHESQN